MQSNTRRGTTHDQDGLMLDQSHTVVVVAVFDADVAAQIIAVGHRMPPSRPRTSISPWQWLGSAVHTDAQNT